MNSSSWSCVHVKVTSRRCPKGRDCLQSKEILNNEVFEYFMKLGKRCAGKGALNRTSESTGLWVLWCCNLVCSSEQDVRSHRFMSFVVLQSWMCSYLEAVINKDSERADGEPIRRRMYQLYKAKENVTFSKLLLTKLRVIAVKPWNIVGFTIHSPSNNVLA